MMSQATARKDFFISYTRADKTWAEWIAFQLEEAGYTTILQAWDFRPGSNFVLEMDSAARVAERTIAVLSPDYFQSSFTPSEWATAFRRDPKGEQHLLVPVRVQPCDVEGLFGSVIYIDLVALEEQEARTALIEGVRRERAKPSSVPFPREARVPTVPPAFPSTLPSVWTVPYRRNPYFTGREGELAFLANGLSTGGTFALTQSLSGLGGIGKTQLAVEYAYRSRDHYSTVLWVSADSRETLIADCTQLVAELKLPEQEEKDQNKMVAALQRWLREQQGWLLILDNVEDLDLVTWFLPAQHQGAVLLTTRRQVTEPVAQTMAMDVLPEEKGALFLLRRTKFLSLDGSLDEATEADRQIAQSIARTLGGLPLALDQAGAYILETGCDLATYLFLYKQRQVELLQRRGSIPSDHPLSVTTTFTLAFEEVRRRSEAAIELLRLCALLAPDAIAEEIIIGGATHLGPVLQPVATDAYALNEITGILRTFSLIKRDPVEKILNIHRLVQAVLKDDMNEKTARQWRKRVVEAVSEVFPEVQPETWARCERLLPHALVCIPYITQENMTSPKTATLLQRVGWYLGVRARYAEAEPLLQRALVMRKEQENPEPLDIVQCLRYLGEIYYYLARYRQSEQHYQEALTLCKQTLGAEHPATAQSLNDLGVLYYTQGEYDRAEPLLTQALTLREHILGSEHLEVSETLNNLAMLYSGKGKYDRAEALLRRAVEIRERTLGPDHPEVTRFLNNLAFLYTKQGKYDQTEPLFERTLDTYERTLGPDHPDVARALIGLAQLYTDQRKYDQAEPLLRRALTIREQKLGAEHPEVVESLNHLAVLYNEQGKYDQAEPLLRRALALHRQAFDPEHFGLAQCLSNLAITYHGKKEYLPAEDLFKQALAMRERALGPDAPLLVYSLRGLANLYADQDRYMEAEPLYQRALKIQERLSPDHLEVATSLESYVHLLRKVGRGLEADSLEERARLIRLKPSR